MCHYRKLKITMITMITLITRITRIRKTSNLAPVLAISSQCQQKIAKSLLSVSVASLVISDPCCPAQIDKDYFCWLQPMFQLNILISQRPLLKTNQYSTYHCHQFTQILIIIITFFIVIITAYVFIILFNLIDILTILLTSWQFDWYFDNLIDSSQQVWADLTLLTFNIIDIVDVWHLTLSTIN